MSLLKPGLGDVTDRASIVARKMIERPDRGDFAFEFKELCEQQALPPSCFVLCALNAAIWQREDRLREIQHLASTKADGSDIALLGWSVAIEIQRLNDRRAALIAELNGTPSEKLYK